MPVSLNNKIIIKSINCMENLLNISLSTKYPVVCVFLNWAFQNSIYIIQYSIGRLNNYVSINIFEQHRIAMVHNIKKPELFYHFYIYFYRQYFPVPTSLPSTRLCGVSFLCESKVKAVNILAEVTIQLSPMVCLTDVFFAFLICLYYRTYIKQT